MQAFIFDMDGVIIDSEKVYEQADQKWFAENGIQTDRIALRRCLGCTDDVNWGMIAKWNPDRDIPEIYRQYREFCKEIRVNYREIYRPYVQTLIDQCHQTGIQTALASSSPMDNILTVIRDCGLENQFDLIVSGCDLPQSKPDPAIFLQCAKQLGIVPAACVVIEDSYNGVTAGKRAGMTVIGLEDPYFGQDLSEADVRVEVLEQIEITAQGFGIKARAAL